MYFNGKTIALGENLMFGISAPELCIILVIAAMIIPPKELPKLVRWSVKQYKRIQDLGSRILRELNLLDL